MFAVICPQRGRDELLMACGYGDWRGIGHGDWWGRWGWGLGVGGCGLEVGGWLLGLEFFEEGPNFCRLTPNLQPTTHNQPILRNRLKVARQSNLRAAMFVS
jgi:hypothetical protein